MRYVRYAAVSVLIVLALVLAGCATPATTETPAPGETPAGVGTPGPAMTPTTGAGGAETPAAGGAGVEPSVTVEDQDIVDGTVTVASVVAAQQGWMVIHADVDGQPGPVIGWTPVMEGENTDVVVEIQTADATPQLHAMLHVDEGTVGTYEFPGADGPVRDAAGAVVNVPFQVTGGLEGAPGGAMTDTPAAGSGTATGEEVTIELVAEDFTFNMAEITVPAGAHVIVEFDNRDVLGHNFAVYTAQSGGDLIFRGDIVNGPAMTTYEFDAPTEPGEYWFQCDPHAPQMNGTFIVE